MAFNVVTVVDYIITTQVLNAHLRRTIVTLNLA